MSDKVNYVVSAAKWDSNFEDVNYLLVPIIMKTLICKVLSGTQVKMYNIFILFSIVIRVGFLII